VTQKIWQPGVGRLLVRRRASDFSCRRRGAGVARGGQRNADAKEIVDGSDELGAKCRRAETAGLPTCITDR